MYIRKRRAGTGTCSPCSPQLAAWASHHITQHELLQCAIKAQVGLENTKWLHTHTWILQQCTYVCTCMQVTNLQRTERPLFVSCEFHSLFVTFSSSCFWIVPHPPLPLHYQHQCPPSPLHSSSFAVGTCFQPTRSEHSVVHSTPDTPCRESERGCSLGSHLCPPPLKIQRARGRARRP